MTNPREVIANSIAHDVQFLKHRPYPEQADALLEALRKRGFAVTDALPRILEWLDDGMDRMELRTRIIFEMAATEGSAPKAQQLATKEQR